MNLSILHALSQRKLLTLKLLLLYVSVALLVGCTRVSNKAHSVKQTSTETCLGTVEIPDTGFVATKDPKLLELALGEIGQGKLCTGVVLKTVSKVTVYRVWNSSKDYSLYGRWWSFKLPKGPREKYRKDNVICPSWSNLDRLSSCTIKVGTNIVIGPGQSATCEHMTLPKSVVNQVFIPNDSLNNQVFVENCSQGVNWP